MLGLSAARFVPGGLLFCALLAGCAGTLQSERLAPADFPTPVELTATAFFPQEDYQCGPAALATALDWAGKKVTPQALAPEIYLPARQGSLQLELLANARRHGAIPYVISPQLQNLLTEVAAGHPVIVLQNLGLSWIPKWHYAVVVGFDVAGDELVLRSGKERRHIVPLATFERTWRRGQYWAMVAMPPELLPRTAEEISYVKAIAALERLGRWEETSTAYTAALNRWPTSLAAQLGLGNSRYALRDSAGAEAAYRAATAAHPDSGVALNNLAQTLSDQARFAEAEALAQRAIALGGPHVDTFHATLAEIHARRARAKPDS